MKIRHTGWLLLAATTGCNADGSFTTSGILVVVSVLAFIGALVVAQIYEGMFGGMPFTARGNMGRTYAKDRDRRAHQYVALGMDPTDAIARAVAEMRKEADEALEQDGK